MIDREKLIELLYENNVRCDQKIEGLVDDILDLIANEVTIQRWNPVTKGLPQKLQDVLTFSTGGKMVVDCVFEDGGWCSSLVNSMGNREITHWMPLPEEPKGE